VVTGNPLRISEETLTVQRWRNSERDAEVDKNRSECALDHNTFRDELTTICRNERPPTS
jgi:hypothetical protein